MDEGSFPLFGGSTGNNPDPNALYIPGMNAEALRA